METVVILYTLFQANKTQLATSKLRRISQGQPLSLNLDIKKENKKENKKQNTRITLNLQWCGVLVVWHKSHFWQ